MGQASMSETGALRVSEHKTSHAQLLLPVGMATIAEWASDDACSDLTAYRAGVIGAGAATAGDLAFYKLGGDVGLPRHQCGRINPTNIDSPIDATCALLSRVVCSH